jgi:hypothetical protein
MVDRQASIAIDPQTDNREATLAFLAVLAADRHNLKWRKAEAKAQAARVEVTLTRQPEPDRTARVVIYDPLVGPPEA